MYLKSGIRYFAIAMIGFMGLAVSACAAKTAAVDGYGIRESVLTLFPVKAETAGPEMRIINGNFEFWSSADTSASWTIDVARPCTVSVDVFAAVDAGYAGSTYQVTIGDQKLTATMDASGGWTEFKRRSLGEIKIAKAGQYKLTIKPISIPNGAFGNLKMILVKGVMVKKIKKVVDLSGPIKVYQSAQYEGSLLEAQDSLSFEKEKPSEVVSVLIDPTKTYQVIEGFGGAFTEAAATTFYKLSPKVRKELITAYFDEEEGIGYSLCRTHINSCDFGLGNYAYTEVDGDVEFKHFTIDRDRKALIPMIKEAKKVASDDFKLFSSPWSPPAWMKTTGKMNNGGKLKAEYRDAWARYYCRYIREYEKEGIDIWGLTVQNEPMAVQRWDSCIYTAEEERDFVRDHLGPALHKQGLGDVKVIIWDHNRNLMVDRARVVFDDPEAAKYVWGTGFHWYEQDCFDHVQMVHDFYPDKKLLFTEGCQEGGPHLGEWGLGERYARSMVNDLNRWTVGWVDWNIMLNIEGGPNHVNNLCSAPIIADVENDKLLYQSSYYYIGHFSRFIKPGAKRILCRNTYDKLLTTAFKNPDGTVAVVVLNLEDFPVDYALRAKANQVVTVSPAHSITTLIIPKGQLSSIF